MATSRYSVVFEGKATGTSLITIATIQAAATERLTIPEMVITFDGVLATATPVLVELRTGIGAGSGGTAATAQKWDPAGPNATSTVLTSAWSTTDPTATAGNIIAAWRVPPTSGLIMQWPLGREPWGAVSSNLGLCVTAAATVNATGYLIFEE